MKINKTDEFIEVIGHYDNEVQCAKMTLLADLYAIEHREGYAKFPIECEDKLRLVDKKLEFRAPVIPPPPGFGPFYNYFILNGITKTVQSSAAKPIQEEVTHLYITYHNNNIYGAVAGETLTAEYILSNGELILENVNPEYTGYFYANPHGSGTDDDPYYLVEDEVVTAGFFADFTTYHTEKSTQKVSVDLTTLTGWSSLSSGTHNITIVAKAENYRDSEPSAAVSVTKAPQEYTDCITFTGETSDFTLAVGSGGAKEWDGTVQYSTDHNTWTTWNGTAVSSVNKKLYLRGSGNTKFYTSKGAQLSLSARAACSGNLNTLLEYSNPPTTLAPQCYFAMFRDCTNLTTAPELPATTLAVICYSNMFRGCTSLTTAPVLPATTLANGCYASMFYGCTSLTQAPTLPATALASNCYQYMFQNCASLKISTTQSSEYRTAWRIPSSGTISSTATDWNYSMLKNTGGTFTGNPSINTTYYGAW